MWISSYTASRTGSEAVPCDRTNRRCIQAQCTEALPYNRGFIQLRGSVSGMQSLSGTFIRDIFTSRPRAHLQVSV